MSRTADEHKSSAPRHLSFAVITISTSRYESLSRREKMEDLSGDLAVKLLHEAGHSISVRETIPDDGNLIRNCMEENIKNKDVEALLTCGGTGVTPTDVTIETVEPLLEKTLPGFGEIFRSISYNKIGSPAIMTRATAGLVMGKAIFCLPGSPQGVEMALRELIIPEVGHIVRHAREK